MGGPTAEGPNDLEPAALKVEPRLAEWRDRLGELTGEQPILEPKPGETPLWREIQALALFAADADRRGRVGRCSSR